MGMHPDCPCTRDCPDRSATYCKTCERGNAWRNKRIELYNAPNKWKDWAIYQHDKNYRFACKSGRYHKQVMSRR